MSYDDEDIPEVDEARQASERAVLGAVIQSARAAEEAALIVSPEQFADASHQAVFTAVMRLADDGEPVDPASVLSELSRTGMLRRVGGPGCGHGRRVPALAAVIGRGAPGEAG